MQSNKDQYTEILDLALCSPNMADKIRNFRVINDYQMESDYCPISFSINLSEVTKFINEIK